MLHRIHDDSDVSRPGDQISRSRHFHARKILVPRVNFERARIRIFEAGVDVKLVDNMRTVLRPLATCSCSKAPETISRPSAAVIKRKFLPDWLAAAVDCALAPWTSAKQSQIGQRTSESPTVHFRRNLAFIFRITRRPPTFAGRSCPFI